MLTSSNKITGSRDDESLISAALDQDELDMSELDHVSGGKATYYQMNGHWYIVGHDKHGHSTGAVRID
ncbi:hypothetical protein [Methylobacterium nonmethylotrophicum]|uniref:Uncharacterized protein n=1 Tax=Methylobacterium nonmethylotrophicum TaxID=1141884 RepID=A0A4Z0NH92_9HYPH|nr:hypothetical protein [Methylobacterium nonmethylotrophicum]TGD95357.1 hypothetical protein EU555_28485 [Methylobacterium nonmethylotrophicum]